MATRRWSLSFVPIFLTTALGCAEGPTTASWSARGKFGIGVRTVTYVDATRATPPNQDFAGAPDRTLVVEVWYPADAPDGPLRDAAPAAKSGPYPLVMHSHGFMDNRRGENYLGEHLASHGYLVASIDYPLSHGGAPGGPTVRDVPNQPLDLRFVIDRLLADATFAPLIDAKKIGASGLSLGGLTTLLAAFHLTLRDARISAALSMAAPACFFKPPFFSTAKLPLLLLHGDSDLLVPVGPNSTRAFEQAQDPRELVVMKRGSHTGFAGFASLFDQSMHFDRIGCDAIQGNIEIDSFSALGSDAEGIEVNPSVCPMPCTTPPVDPALGAERHHELTNLVAAAFFAARLRGDGNARAFLEKALADENPELTLRVR